MEKGCDVGRAEGLQRGLGGWVDLYHLLFCPAEIFTTPVTHRFLGRSVSLKKLITCSLPDALIIPTHVFISYWRGRLPAALNTYSLQSSHEWQIFASQGWPRTH